MGDDIARQMVGQRAAHRFNCRRIGLRWGRLFEPVGRGSLLFLQILQRQFDLMDGAAQPFRRAAKLHAPQLGELRPQPGNQLRPLIQFLAQPGDGVLMLGNFCCLRRDQRLHRLRQGGDIRFHAVTFNGGIESRQLNLA
jgi:hypothetical protein